MEGGVTSTWLSRHRPMYNRATRHPFVLAIRDGTVDLSSFKRWLGQDYIFVRGLVPFVASVLLKACKQSTDDDSHMEEILGGVASLNEEISWFKKEASKWDIDLSSVTPKKANIDYARLLQGLTLPEVDFSVAMTAFWAIEVVYQESFSVCLETGSKTPAELLETCQRWGSADFGMYCHSLQKIADSYLEKSSDDVLKKAEDAFCSVLEHEIGFWNMSSDEH